MMKLGLVVLAAAAIAPFAATAFSTLLLSSSSSSSSSSSLSTSFRRPPSSSTAISYASKSSSRRDILAHTLTSAILIATTSSIVTRPLAALAAAAAATAGGGEPPTPAEIERIQTGYNNIQYLLANWEKETTVCKSNGGQCERNADACRRYLGLRSTTDPLFQIEKVFAKVRFIEDIDPEKLDAFFEATEDWNTAMNMTNSMSFISQFAEYNPGGGKDEVLKYLNEAQTQVILAEKALKTILDCISTSSTSTTTA